MIMYHISYSKIDLNADRRKNEGIKKTLGPVVQINFDH